MRAKIVLILFGFVLCGFAGTQQHKPNDKQIQALSNLKSAAVDQQDVQIQVIWNKKAVPAFIKGDFVTTLNVKNDEEAALQFINQLKDAYKMSDAAQEFLLERKEVDDLGISHFRFQQTYRGLPVYARELLVHIRENGNVSAINGDYEPEIDIETKADISAESAVEIAIKDVNAEKYRWEDAFQEDILDRTSDKKSWYPEAELLIFPHDGNFYLAYYTMIAVELPSPGNWEYFIDAHTGKVILKRNSLNFDATTGEGITVTGDNVTLNTYLSSGTYYLYDETKYMSGSDGQIRTYIAGSSLPGSYSTDSDNNWESSSQRAEVSAHYYAGKVYDYYYSTHGRNSYDGNGADIISSVHYGDNYNNAFWNGSQMVYGDGDGTTFRPLSGALDIVCHELTHAVTSKTAQLIYQDQSGALNEAFSDIFASCIDRNDWWIGEDVYTPGISGDGLRSMSDPTLGIFDPENPWGGGQPDHMDDYIETSEDNGGVHLNNGIPNKAFYNVVQSIGFDPAEKIYYRALTVYINSSAQFIDVRNDILQACSDLYGETDGKYADIQDAWADVGVGSGSSGGTGDTYEPNNSTSQAYGPLTSETTYSSYIYSSTDVDYFKFTAASSGTATVNLANFPGDYDFYVYNSSGTEVAKGYTASDPENQSFSVSSGVYYVKVAGYNGAFSTTDDYELTVTYPSSGGTSQWYYESASYDTPHNYSNNYDSYHEYSKPGAQKVAVYFSKFETETDCDFVYIYDKNGTETAVYHGVKSAFWAVVDGDYIKVRLVSDGSITKYGYHINQTAYYSDQQLLQGEATGADITAAPSDKINPNACKIKEFKLLGNSPNPFNPTTEIAFELPVEVHVKIQVYNINGQLIKTLVDKKMAAGQKCITWNSKNKTGNSVPSGTYFYRIEAGDFNQTKKMLLIK